MVELRVLVMLLPACCHKLASLFHVYVALFLRCFRWLSYTHDVRRTALLPSLVAH